MTLWNSFEVKANAVRYVASYFCGVVRKVVQEQYRNYTVCFLGARRRFISSKSGDEDQQPTSSDWVTAVTEVACCVLPIMHTWCLLKLKLLYGLTSPFAS